MEPTIHTTQARSTLGFFTYLGALKIMNKHAYRLIIAPILALALLVGTARAAEADFTFASETAVFNPATQEVTFRIVFNQVPDFLPADAFSRRANSFQYFVLGDPSLPYPANYDAIIRGDEIDTTTGQLPIRNSVPPADTDLPEGGGWGSIRGTVPYQLQGRVLTFSVPLRLISDHNLNGRLMYELESYQYGSYTQHVESQVKGRKPPQK
jgi:hypothetical protein